MFKFKIRELLLLTLVAAMGMGWWVDHRRQANAVALQRFEAGMYRYLTRYMEDEGYRLIWQHDGNMLTILRPDESLPGEN